MSYNLKVKGELMIFQKYVRTSTVLAGLFELIRYICEDTGRFYGRDY